MAEFRQAARAWTEAYSSHDFVLLTPQEWELHHHQASNVDVLFIAMRLQTMARARETNSPGPGLIRNRRWPWGMPQVTGSARDALENDNRWIRLALSAINKVATHSRNPTILWTAPEDRGGESANLWQLPELRLFATRGGWFRYAFYQCEMTTSRNPRPTAVLSLSPLRDKTLSKGWPKLTNSNKAYLGPLKISCSCGQTHEPWSKIPRRQTSTVLEQGVLERLLLIARQSGLARHLRTGKHQAHQATSSRSHSVSPSPSSSSLCSATTCVSSPSIAGENDLDTVQWDDEAADALDLPKRIQDSSATIID